MTIKRKYLLVSLSALIILYMVYESLSLPAGEDLKGNFKELAFYRNEQNTGPVLRIYAVSVNDTVWNEMETYGNYMPHTKYGKTQVFYFLNQKPAHRLLSPADGSFDKQYEKACIAKYEKGAMGQTVLVRYPFKSSR